MSERSHFYFNYFLKTIQKNKIKGMLAKEESRRLFILSHYVNLNNKNPIIVEIGTNCGLSTCFLAKNGGIVYTIDPHPIFSEEEVKGSYYLQKVYYELSDKMWTYKKAIENFEKCNLKNIKLITGYSFDVANQIQDDISLIFIDGLHDKENVLQDLKYYYEKVKTGGIIAFHDWGRFYDEIYKDAFGVTEALHEFLGVNYFKKLCVEHDNSVAWFIK